MKTTVHMLRMLALLALLLGCGCAWAQVNTGGNGSVSLPTTQVSAASYAGADWCAKVQAADAAIGANPGIIVVPSTIAGTCSGTLTFAYNGLTASRRLVFDFGKFGPFTLATLPNNGNVSNPGQTSFRFSGQAVSFSALNKTSPDGTFLDLTENNATGKIRTLGAGTLEFDHIILEDDSTDCAPFLFTTNTSLLIPPSVVFLGTAAGASACNDAIILGGTGTSIGNTTSSEFTGYGTRLDGFKAEQIRRVLVFQSSANNVQATNIDVDSNCGYTGGTIEFNPSTQASGNVITGWLVESTHYGWFVNVITNTGTVQGNTFAFNGTWDGNVTSTGAYNLNAITNTNVSGNIVYFGVASGIFNLVSGIGNNYYFGPQFPAAGGAPNIIGRYGLSGSTTFANLSKIPTVTGNTIWITDGTVGATCAGSGAGALGVYNGTAWVCK